MSWRNWEIILLVGALVWALASLLAACIVDNWEVFQRSGSILAFSGGMVAGAEAFYRRRPLNYQSLRNNPESKFKEFEDQSINYSRERKSKKLLRPAVIVSAVGTLIWGYGDLIFVLWG
ncbi:MAG: hypothetical protein ABJO97_18945 [Roseibium sp.]|uniref:hypothetical protein n=1 Tax=Alphaproteobacteria TaxID=28211 RepID=UPI00329792D4